VNEEETQAAEYLQEWHRRHPGATATVLAPLADASGRSSYDVLAEAIGQGGEPVLDLACGDGHLLELLGPGRSCLGTDRSAAELAAARERLGHTAPLIRADAARLPLVTGQLGVVSCHYALMLLQPLEQVLAELARVLRPGGLLAAVLPSSSPREVADPVSAYRSAWREVSETYPVEIPQIQDDRALDPEELTTVLTDADFTSVSVQPFSASKVVTVDEAVQSFFLTYLPDLLPPAGLTQLKRTLESKLAELAGGTGVVTYALHSDLVTAQRG
jgi:ubiquinone/menaquinone biosynthesis C-methylase UbiE